MKAVIQTGYGSTDVLDLRDIDRPVPGDDDVLVRVHSAALHAGDVFCMAGVPYIARMAVGLPRPKSYVPGLDAAGYVEAVGGNVSRFRPGDEVFGECGRACADYTCAAEDMFVLKPKGLSLEQAAAVPTSALAALRGLRDAAKVEKGQRVLINGASGGVGTFAVQIARSMGAEVTGVCSTRNVDMVRSIGADHVIDYTREDFRRGDGRYDAILDNVGNCTLSGCRRVLTPRGILVPNSGNAGLGYVLKAFVLSLFARRQGAPFIAMPNPEDLNALKELVESGAFKPVIDRTYPLSRIREAMGYLAEGHARGKVVISVDSENAA